MNARNLTIHCALTLAALLALSVFGFVNFYQILLTRDQTLAAVTLVTEQKARAMRVLAMAAVMSATDRRGEAQSYASELRKAAAALREGHEDMLAGSRELGLSAPEGPDLKALLFSPPVNLDKAATEFLRRAEALAALAQPPGADNPDLGILLKLGRLDLPAAYDQIAGLYRAEGRASVNSMLKMEYLILVLVMAGLAYAAFFVYRPAAAAISAEHEKAEQAQAQVKQMASLDELTHLPNRRRYKEVLAREMAYVQRYKVDLSGIKLDVDGLRRVNDEHGHSAGDEALAALAALLRKVVRKTDHVFRWGGDKFIILAPHTAGDKAAVFADKLRAAVERADFPQGVRLSITTGVAQCLPSDDFETFLKKIDDALHQAKAAAPPEVAAPLSDPLGQGA